jgi:hypothetical protein
MDPGSLATLAASLLVPTLPYLSRAATGASGKLGEQLGAEAAERMADLWDAVWDRLRGDRKARKAVEQAAEDPRDPEREADVADALRRHLASDPAFTAEVADLLERAESALIAGRDNISVVGDNARIQTGGIGDNARIQTGGFHIEIGQAGHVHIRNDEP